jgi:hypothetical protein
MEKSNLISSIILKLKLAYPSYFNKLTDEELIALAQMYKDELSKYNEKTLNIAIKNAIRSYKYMPSLNEIIEECESNKTHNANTIIERMKKDGYFKSPSELDKVYMWLAKGIIPSWLREDMKNYQQGLLTNNTRLIEMSD